MPARMEEFWTRHLLMRSSCPDGMSVHDTPSASRWGTFMSKNGSDENIYFLLPKKLYNILNIL